MSLNLPFKGIITPLVTPLTQQGHLDVDSLTGLLDHIIEGGVHGVFVLGTSGEAPSLSHEMQREIVAHACQHVDHRIPVLVGISDTSPDESIALAQFAAEQEADAVVLAAPYYFPMHQRDLERYVRDVAPGLPLPFLLYNMPSHTKVSFEVSTIERLLDVDGLVGVKDSSGNMHYFNQLLQLVSDRSDFSLLMGPEELMAESVLMGGHGGISGGSNLFPELYVSLYEAAVTEDLRSTHRLQQTVMRLSKAIYNVGPPPTGYLTGIKAALSMFGLCTPQLASPLYPLSDQELAQIRQHLVDLGYTQQLVTEGS